MYFIKTWLSTVKLRACMFLATKTPWTLPYADKIIPYVSHLNLLASKCGIKSHFKDISVINETPSLANYQRYITFLLLTFLYFSVIFSLQCKCAHFLTILELRNCTEVCTSMLTSVKTYLITFQNEINYKHLQNRYRLSIFLIDLLFPVRLITTSRWTPKFPEMGQSFYLSLHQLFSFHWNSPCSLFIMISRWCSDSPSGSLLKIPFLECSWKT